MRRVEKVLSGSLKWDKNKGSKSVCAIHSSHLAVCRKAPRDVIHAIDFQQKGDKAEWQLQTITQLEMKVKGIAVLALKDCWTFIIRKAHVSESSHVVNRKYSMNIFAESRVLAIFGEGFRP